MKFKIAVKSLVLAASLGAMPAPSAAVAQEKIDVTNAWARATVPGQKVGAVYMDIRSATHARLASASSPAAGRVELHNMTMQNGVMRMAPVDGITLPPGQSVSFAPGSYHVMLFDLKRELKQGSNLTVVLTIETPGKKRQTIEVKAEIRDVTGTTKAH